ncbi:MAG: phosphotransferase [Chloroflexia bacterium]
MKAMPNLPIPKSPDDEPLFIVWLTTVLQEAGAIGRTAAPLREVRWEIIGQESGFTGVVTRIRLDHYIPQEGALQSLVAKFPNAPRLVQSTYRTAQAGDPEATRRFYERCAREVYFYRDIAAHGTAPTPRMYYGAADMEAGRFVLLLEDLAHFRGGDALLSSSESEAEAVVRAIAPFHARWWEHPTLDALKWLPRWGGDPETAARRYAGNMRLFLDRHGPRIPSHVRPLIESLAPNYAKLISTQGSSPLTIVHADLHLDNVLFGPEDSSPEVKIIDWQTVSRGRAGLDLGSFLFGSLDITMRRRIEGDLRRLYYSLLAEDGVKAFTPEDLLRDCRLALLWQLGGTVNWLASVDIESLAGRERALIESIFSEGRLFAALADHHASDLLPL